MTQVFKRLLFVTEEVKVHFLVHLFLFMSGTAGIAFTFFDHTETVQATVLYEQGVVVFNNLTLNIFGVVGISVTILNTLMLAFRKHLFRYLSTLIPLLGLYMWCYAGAVYIASDYYYQLAFAVVPNLAFWGWYMIRVEQMRGNEQFLNL